MFDDEQEFKITPITKVTSVGNQLLDNCLSPSMCDFKAIYKNAEVLIIIPLVFRNNSFSVGKSLLE